MAGNEGCATKILGELTGKATGAKSLKTSKPGLLNRDGLMTKELLTNKRVYPSAGDFATWAIPMFAEPPGLFSTMNDLPRFSDNY